MIIHVYLSLTLSCFLYHATYSEESKTDADELLDLFLKELTTSVEPEDQTSFLDICITKRNVCTEDEFSGERALFKWKITATPRFKERFWRAYKCVFRNIPSFCPVDGDWTEWTGWSTCDAECENEGVQVRTRACENPKPSGGGDRCLGSKSMHRSCIGRCIKSADGKEEATKYVDQIHEMHPDLKDLCMTQHCLYDEARHRIKDTMKLTKYWSSLYCIKYGGACPVNGGWGKWSSWTECTTQCGWGERVRTRECDDPLTENGGMYCQDNYYQHDKCLGTTCSDGETFTSWSEFSPCTETCGKYGTKTSIMACLSPKPCLLDGKRVSEITKTIPCFGGKCPNEGSWGRWGGWGACSALCGPGRQTRLRHCDQPYPYGGRPCNGPAIDVTTCAGRVCVQVPSDEEDDDDDDDDDLRRRRSLLLSGDVPTSLSVKSGSGNEDGSRDSRFSGGYLAGPYHNVTMGKLRKIRAVLPYNASVDEEPVIDKSDPYRNPLDPELESLYTLWGPWTTCSKSCGAGTRTRHRTCKDRLTVCRGEVQPVQLCNLAPCTVPGGWSAWQEWTACTVTCGSGTSTRYRTCDNPLPAYGGSCLGLNSQAQHCVLTACPPAEVGAWSPWGDWSDCSATCGGGAKTRTKFRSLMIDTKSEERVCGLVPCPEDGEWGAWSGWSECTKQCGLGNSYRDRTCTDPAPVYGGKPCEGVGSEIEACFSGPCSDEDDYGVLFEGKGLLQYYPSHKTTFIVVFLRFKPLHFRGTLFHHTRSCSEHKASTCDVSISLAVANAGLILTARVTKAGDDVVVKHPGIVHGNAWNDAIVVVTSKWAEFTLNRGPRAVQSLTKTDEPVDLSGDLQIGMNIENNDGFHGIISALRKNFRVLYLLSVKGTRETAYPHTTVEVKKIVLPSSVRHPDFQGTFYSHLYFRKSEHLYIKAMLQTRETDGLILFNGGNHPSSFLSLIMEKGMLKICISCDDNPKCRSTNQLKVGEWFLLDVSVEGKSCLVRINDGDAIQIMCPRGREYSPRTSLYVGGAVEPDWSVIIGLTKSNARFYGLVDALYLNGVLVSYKMATLMDVDGEVNSLGYSVADHVTEVKSHGNSMVSLKCGVPESRKADHYVKILWLKDMTLLQADKDVEIINTDSNVEYASKLNLYPENDHDGVYACLLSLDGELTVSQVFVVQEYPKEAVGDKEGRAEWIGLIVIFALLIFVILPLFLLWLCKDKISFLRKSDEAKDGEDEEDTDDEEKSLLGETDETEGDTTMEGDQVETRVNTDGEFRLKKRYRSKEKEKGPNESMETTIDEEASEDYDTTIEHVDDMLTQAVGMGHLGYRYDGEQSPGDAASPPRREDMSPQSPEQNQRTGSFVRSINDVYGSMGPGFRKKVIRSMSQSCGSSANLYPPERVSDMRTDKEQYRTFGDINTGQQLRSIRKGTDCFDQLKTSFSRKGDFNRQVHNSIIDMDRQPLELPSSHLYQDKPSCPPPHLQQQQQEPKGYGSVMFTDPQVEYDLDEEIILIPESSQQPSSPPMKLTTSREQTGPVEALLTHEITFCPNLPGQSSKNYHIESRMTSPVMSFKMPRSVGKPKISSPTSPQRTIFTNDWSSASMIQPINSGAVMNMNKKFRANVIEKRQDDPQTTSTPRTSASARGSGSISTGRKKRVTIEESVVSGMEDSFSW